MRNVRRQNLAQGIMDVGRYQPQVQPRPIQKPAYGLPQPQPFTPKIMDVPQGSLGQAPGTITPQQKPAYGLPQPRRLGSGRQGRDLAINALLGKNNFKRRRFR